MGLSVLGTLPFSHTSLTVCEPTRQVTVTVFSGLTVM